MHVLANDFFFSPSLDKEETGDEEECDNGKVICGPLVHVLGALAPLVLLHVICHQKVNSEFAPVQSSPTASHHSDK